MEIAWLNTTKPLIIPNIYNNPTINIQGLAADSLQEAQPWAGSFCNLPPTVGQHQPHNLGSSDDQQGEAAPATLQELERKGGSTSGGGAKKGPR